MCANLHAVFLPGKMRRAGMVEKAPCADGAVRAVGQQPGNRDAADIVGFFGDFGNGHGISYWVQAASNIHNLPLHPFHGRQPRRVVEAALPQRVGQAVVVGAGGVEVGLDVGIAVVAH